MDEYEASCMRVEKISTAVQNIKDSLTCRICLELFDEPVTIKCGHKFCRTCILRVTNNENSSCPFCNTKIQKRSIPKDGNAMLQASVRQFENIIKAIQIDSGIDVSQPYNKVKNTKESTVDYCKPSTSKIEDTPSTSKGFSLISSQKSAKPTFANPARRLSLKKKPDTKSPSQSSDKNTLHKYLSNKSDPVPDQVVQSQEKVKYWLESCTSDDNESVIRGPTVAQSKKLDDNFTTNQITTPPDQIFSNPQENEAKEVHVSPAATSETSSESKYKETQMRIQEAEMMAKKRRLSLKEKSTVKTPSSVPTTSSSDAHWRTVKQVGREMQVKTFKTLDVSKEKCSPSLAPSPAADDTVLYNSTNNDSKNISHDSHINSSSEKTPLQTRKKYPLKSENNNLIKKSPQIVIEDYKHRSMDSTASPKQDIVTEVDENQLNEIIGLIPSRVSKTPEKARLSSSSSSVKNSNSKFKSNQSSPSKRKSNSEKGLSDDELSRCISKATVIDSHKSSLKRNRLSLKRVESSTDFKDSLPETSNKTCQGKKESNNHSVEKSKSRLSIKSLNNKSSSITNESATSKPIVTDNLSNKRSSSSSSGFRFSFQKLGKMCKKKKNVPFLYLGKLDKDKLLDLTKKPRRKTGIVMKSIVPVCIDYKSLMDDNNIANLEEFSSDDSQSKIVSPSKNLQLKSTTKRSLINEDDKGMDIDKDIDIIHKPGPSNQSMEIDDTLPPAKVIVERLSTFDKRNSESENDEPTIEEFSPKSSRKSIKSKNSEKEPLKIDENVPELLPRIHNDNTSKESKTETENCYLISASSSKVNTAIESSDFIQTKLSTTKKIVEKGDVKRIPDDLISISSDESDLIVVKAKGKQVVDKIKYNDKSPKKSIRSDVESCTDSEVSVKSKRRNEGEDEDAMQRYSSTSSSSLKTTRQKKRTHSESSNDDDDAGMIIDKWLGSSAEDKVTKKAKIAPDSEEMLNQNASKVRHRSRNSLSSSSDEQDETILENKLPENSAVDEMIPRIKSQEVIASKLIAMPSSLMSADLFESNEQSIQPTAPPIRKCLSEIIDKASSAVDSDPQSDKENESERSRENITVVDTRQLKRRKSISSKSSNNSDKENKEYRQTSDHNQSIKTEEQADEIESSQKNKNKTVDFESETDPYFVRESLLNVTQDQIACKNIEKDLFGVDLSKIHEIQNEDPLDNDKCSTPQRKSNRSLENDDFDSDNIEATPVARKRHVFRLPSSQTSPKSDVNISGISLPEKRTCLIPAITPVKNTKSYPLCHSTPMITTDSLENRNYSQTESIKIVCSSLSAENTKLVQKFVDRFDAEFQTNFDMSVTHVVVKVDPQTRTAPKTFKYIQGIAFKKYVVSFEWITDCLAKNKLLDVDDEKYDVLDQDMLESGSKKSRKSSRQLFRHFAFCCLEPFEKVPLNDFKELLTYNGAVIVPTVAAIHDHKDKLKIIVIGGDADDLTDVGVAMLHAVDAAAVFFEWVVDSVSQYQVLSLASYLCETTLDKARSLGFPPDLLIEEETMEGDEYEDDN